MSETNAWRREVADGALTAVFFGDGRMPKCPPDPRFPDGKDADITAGLQGCSITLERPTPCCGYWVIECAICGHRVAVSAAGRIDDPRTIKIDCHPIPEA